MNEKYIKLKIIYQKKSKSNYGIIYYKKYVNQFYIINILLLFKFISIKKSNIKFII